MVSGIFDEAHEILAGVCVSSSSGAGPDWIEMCL